MINEVTTPKNWPAPLTAYRSSEFSFSETVMNSPLAVTKRAETMLSDPKPTKGVKAESPPPTLDGMAPTVLPLPKAAVY